MLLTPKSSKISLIKNIVLPQGYKNSFQKSKGQAEGQKGLLITNQFKANDLCRIFSNRYVLSILFLPPS